MKHALIISALALFMQQIDLDDLAPPAAAAAAAAPVGLHHVPERSDVNADGGAQHMQIDLDGLAPHQQLVPQVMPQQKYYGSDRGTAARNTRLINDLRAKVAALEGQNQDRKNLIDTVAVMLPGAAGLLGRQPTSIGRTKISNLRPDHFGLCVRALHLPLNRTPSLGVKSHRLLEAGCQVIERRQLDGLKDAMRRSGTALRNDTSHTKFVHLTHCHMWDEVQLNFKSRESFKNSRKRLKAVSHQTLVQRGQYHLTLGNCGDSHGGGDTVTVSEEWLIRPRVVEGTSADAIDPPIMASIPDIHRYDEHAKLSEFLKGVSSMTFQPMCDRASGNILFLKRLCFLWENVLLMNPDTEDLLVFIETCGVHGHHRAKIQVRGLKPHTMMQYCISKLYRLQTTYTKMTTWLEARLAKVRRLKCEAPSSHTSLTLATVCDILYGLSSKSHLRKDGKHSRQYLDLQAAIGMFNGSLKDEIVHYCWDSETQAPCCTSPAETAEKCLRAAVDSMFGTADPIPGESTWTHVLPNFRRTLYRRCLFRLGLDCFTLQPPKDHADFVDISAGEASEKLRELLHGARIKKVRTYYDDDATFHDLAVLTVSVGIFDKHLLYPLLGDKPNEGSGDGQPTLSKVGLLLDQRRSLIGECQKELLSLFGPQWANGGPARKPWAILEAVDAPLRDEGFMRRSRGAILRLNTSVFRRYEVKYSTWPYKLYALVDLGATDEMKDQVVEELLGAPRTRGRWGSTPPPPSYGAGWSSIVLSPTSSSSSSCLLLFLILGLTFHFQFHLHPPPRPPCRPLAPCVVGVVVKPRCLQEGAGRVQLRHPTAVRHEGAAPELAVQGSPRCRLRQPPLRHREHRALELAAGAVPYAEGSWQELSARGPRADDARVLARAYRSRRLRSSVVEAVSDAGPVAIGDHRVDASHL